MLLGISVAATTVMLFSIPDEVPGDGVEVQTGIACPDCSGTLIVVLRQRFAAFRCRIGHAYSLPELLAAKEDMLERVACGRSSLPLRGWQVYRSGRSTPRPSARGAAVRPIDTRLSRFLPSCR